MQSEVEFSADILQSVPIEQWPLLQELLRDDWPNYSNYYYWIQNSIEWKKKDPDLALEIYSSQGKYGDDVTFVGISSFSIWDVCIFTKDRAGKRLYEALIRTNRFDWSKEITFSGVNENVEPILSSALAFLQTNRGIEINSVTRNYIHMKPANECTNIEITVPEECYLVDLNPSHLQLIHSMWPRTSQEEPESSMKLLQTLLRLNKCIGLVLKEGDVLVSWVLQNEWHGLGIAQTLGPYKRRGFSKIVINALSKQLAKEGISSTSCIATGNIASNNMAASLGWKPIIPCVRIIMKKQTLGKTPPLKAAAEQIPLHHEPSRASNKHLNIKKNVHVLRSRI